MNQKDILKNLKAKKYEPVYFLTGTENYFIDEISEYIKEHTLSPEEKEFNQTVVYGRDTDLTSIVSLAKGFPMMGERQVVIVKEAQDLNWKKEDGQNQLASYLNQPQPTTILVFEYKNKKLDKRTKVGKAIQKQALFFESKELYESKLPQWIKEYVGGKNHKIDEKAVILLSEYLGNNLSKMANELDKLMIMIPKGETISPIHIEKNIGISKDYNTFELQKALAQKEILKANRIIKYFAANPKDHPLPMILPLLYKFFSGTLVYRTLPDKSQNVAARELGVHPFALNDYATAARNYSNGKLARIITYLREADKKSKGFENYSVSTEFLMKELVHKILH